MLINLYVEKKASVYKIHPRLYQAKVTTVNNMVATKTAIQLFWAQDTLKQRNK